MLFFNTFRFFRENNVRIDLKNLVALRDDRKSEKFVKIQQITAQISQMVLTGEQLPLRAACALHLVYAVGCGGKFVPNADEFIESLSAIFVQSECEVRKRDENEVRWKIFLFVRFSFSFVFHFNTDC